MTLRGTVTSEAEREEAETAAWFAGGVAEVKHEIKVEPWPVQAYTAIDAIPC